MSGKGKKILGLICLLLASWAVGVFLAFVYYQEPFWPLTNLSVGGSDENGEDDSSITLALSTDNAQFYVGTPGEMTLSVSSLDSDAIPESVTIVDDQEQTVATVALDADGNGATTLSIGAEEEYVGTLQAVAGDAMSDKLYYYVQPEVTEAMMQTLVDVAADLYTYVSDMNADDPYSDESLEAVKEWLEADSRVGAAEIYSPYVIYITADGLAGSYGMGEYEEGYAGKSTVSEAYEAMQSGKSTEDFYVASALTMTNTNITMLEPDVFEEEEEHFTGVREVAKTALERLAESTGGSLTEIKGVNVIDALDTGDYLDSGFVFFSTHGNVLTENVSSPMLYFQLAEVTGTDYEELTAGKTVSGRMNQFSGSGNGGIKPEAFRLVYDVTASGHFTIRGTRNYLADGIGNQYFDNTVIYFLVCHAASDTTLLRLFEKSGAAAFIGTKDNFQIEYGGILLEEIVDILGGNTNATSVEDFKGLEDLALVDTLDDDEPESFRKYFYQFQLDLPENRDKGISYEDMYEWDEQGSQLNYENPSDKTQQRGTWQDYAYDMYEFIRSFKSGSIARVYLFREEDFSMTGGGMLFGHVEATQGVALPGADVTVYHWLNHQFTEVAKTVTDEDGAYSCEELPFGLYVIEAQYAGESAYTTMELNIQDRKADTIIVGPKVYCTLTSEDGTVELGSLSVKVITQLEDGNCTILELDGTKLVEAEGRFLICNAWEADSCQVDVYYGTTLLKRYSINEINSDTQDVTLDLSLAYLDVIVNDDSGNFLSGASVSISGKEGDSGAGGVEQSAVLGTNESGQSVYRLPVTPGTYYISVTAGDDELAQNDEVVVQGNTTVTYPMDYYQFIHDELLPEMGYASMEDSSKYLNMETARTNACWDQRRGLLGADIADLNSDGTDELLVYYFIGNEDSYDSNYIGVETALYTDVYTVTEDNEITKLSHVKLFSDSNRSWKLARGGLMEVKGQLCLYVQTEEEAYFADGNTEEHAWYGMDAEGNFRKLWSIGKTDGGSICIAYSLLDYSQDADQPVKTVLWADGGFRSTNPDTPVLSALGTDYSASYNTRLDEGFVLLGLSDVEYENQEASSYLYPTLWYTCKQSWDYECIGKSGDSYSEKNMTVSVQDLTELKAHLEGIDSASE